MRSRDEHEREANEDRERGLPSMGTIGLVGDGMMAAASVYGLATSPPEPPNTDQLSDTHQSQVDRYRDSIGDASNQRDRPGTSGS